MRIRTWVRAKPKPSARPDVPVELRESVEALAGQLIASLKRRYCGRKKLAFSQPQDFLARWHRGAMYFVTVMATPDGWPRTFETRIARMEHAGNGKFNLAVPMRRGWNTVTKEASPEKCLEEIAEFAWF